DRGLLLFVDDRLRPRDRALAHEVELDLGVVLLEGRRRRLDPVLLLGAVKHRDLGHSAARLRRRRGGRGRRRSGRRALVLVLVLAAERKREDHDHGERERTDDDELDLHTAATSATVLSVSSNERISVFILSSSSFTSPDSWSVACASRARILTIFAGSVSSV